jgi:hypothetical protein
MSIRSRDIRIVRKDKLHKTRSTRNLVDGGGGGGCPTISLGDFVGEQPYIDGSVDANGAYITGGEGPYTMTLESGSLPGGVTGLMSVETEPGIWAWLFEGTFYTDLEICTFTIGGTDANGCPITPREYTIQVRARFTNAAPGSWGPGGTGQAPITCSGLPVLLGTGIAIHSISINNASGTDLSDISIVALDPSTDQAITLIGVAAISGTQITEAVFNETSIINISSSSQPYTGEWNDSEFSSGFSEFDGYDPNGTWSFDAMSQLSSEGELTTVTIIFKPI